MTMGNVAQTGLRRVPSDPIRNFNVVRAALPRACCLPSHSLVRNIGIGKICMSVPLVTSSTPIPPQKCTPTRPSAR